MIRKENETKEIEIVKDIICNKCGNSCKTGECSNFEYADLTAHWGYFSSKDGEVHEAHLCESCWESVVATFKYTDLVAENVL